MAVKMCIVPLGGWSGSTAKLKQEVSKQNSEPRFWTIELLELPVSMQERIRLHPRTVIWCAILTDICTVSGQDRPMYLSAPVGACAVNVSRLLQIRAAAAFFTEAP